MGSVHVRIRREFPTCAPEQDASRKFEVSVREKKQWREMEGREETETRT